MSNLEALSERERAVANKRAAILDKFYGLKDSGCNAAKACAQVGVSRPTISRWSKAFNDHGLVGLADKTSKRRAGKSLMTEDQKQFLHKATLTQPKPNLKSIYSNDYIQYCTSLDQEPVSYETFVREYHKIPENIKAQYLKSDRARKT